MSARPRARPAPEESRAPSSQLAAPNSEWGAPLRPARTLEPRETLRVSPSLGRCTVERNVLPAGCEAGKRQGSTALGCRGLEETHVLLGLQALPGLLSSLALSQDKGAAGAGPAVAREPACAAGARYAYVTLLTQGAYLRGVQALYRSLRRVGARHRLVVLYTAGVGDAALRALSKEGGMLLRYTQQFEADGVDHSNYKRKLYIEVFLFHGKRVEHSRTRAGPIRVGRPRAL